jgi:hypothetical protein
MDFLRYFVLMSETKRIGNWQPDRRKSEPLLAVNSGSYRGLKGSNTRFMSQVAEAGRRRRLG